MFIFFQLAITCGLDIKKNWKCMLNYTLVFYLQNGKKREKERKKKVV